MFIFGLCYVNVYNGCVPPLPTVLKQTQVTTLLRKPPLNPAHVEIYRPISLLPILSKILEPTVFNQVSESPSENNDPNQTVLRLHSCL